MDFDIQQGLMAVPVLAAEAVAGDREAASGMSLEGHDGWRFGRDFEADVIAMQVQFDGLVAGPNHFNRLALVYAQCFGFELYLALADKQLDPLDRIHIRKDSKGKEQQGGRQQPPR